MRGAGSTRLRILKFIFHQILLSNPIGKLYQLPYLSLIPCAHDRKKSLPKLMENNKNHGITLPKGRIGFSSLDLMDREEPKYQIQSPYELTNAIISTDERYNDWFLLHYTTPAQSSDEFLRKVHGTQKTQLFNNLNLLGIVLVPMPG